MIRSQKRVLPFRPKSRRREGDDPRAEVSSCHWLSELCERSQCRSQRPACRRRRPDEPSWLVSPALWLSPRQPQRGDPVIAQFQERCVATRRRTGSIGSGVWRSSGWCGTATRLTEDRNSKLDRALDLRTRLGSIRIRCGASSFLHINRTTRLLVPPGLAQLWVRAMFAMTVRANDT
jgi:hypothetical protein